MPWRVRPRSVSSLCPCRLNLDSRQCPGPTPAAPSPPSEHRSGHFKQLPANMFGGSERDIEKSCTCHAQRRRRCRNRNSQRRALAHAWPSKGPHRIIPYQHSKNRLNKPKIKFILDSRTLALYPQNLAVGHHSFVLATKRQSSTVFCRFKRTKGLSSSPY